MNGDLHPSDRPEQFEDSPKATTVFVLGVVGVIFFLPLAFPAFFIANSEFKEGYPGKGLLFAGWVLGLIGIILLGIIFMVSAIIFIMVEFL